MGPRGRPQLHFAFGLFSGLLSTTTSTSAAMNTSRRCNRRCLCSACDFLACRARAESRACEAVGLGGLVDHLEKTRIDRQIGLGRPPGIEQKGHDREDRAAGERRSDLWIAPQRFERAGARLSLCAPASRTWTKVHSPGWQAKPRRTAWFPGCSMPKSRWMPSWCDFGRHQGALSAATIQADTWNESHRGRLRSLPRSSHECVKRFALAGAA